MENFKELLTQTFEQIKSNHVSDMTIKDWGPNSVVDLKPNCVVNIILSYQIKPYLHQPTDTAWSTGTEVPKKFSLKT